MVLHGWMSEVDAGAKVILVAKISDLLNISGILVQTYLIVLKLKIRDWNNQVKSFT